MPVLRGRFRVAGKLQQGKDFRRRMMHRRNSCVEKRHSSLVHREFMTFKDKFDFKEMTRLAILGPM
jgi:hypothetical protein